MVQPTRTPRYLAAIVATGFVFLTACSKADDAAPAAGTPAASAAAANQAEEDLADVTQYRLTMDKYDKYLAAQKNIMMKAKSLTPEQRKAMEERNDARDSNNANLDEMTRNIEAEPMMVSAIRDAGLSPREYAVLTVSIMQSAMAAGVAKMQPNANQDSLIREMKANPDNVRFFQQNEAELTRKQTELAAELKRLGIDEESLN